jgi:DNA-binding NarL/FixJ family response regulator
MTAMQTTVENPKVPRSEARGHMRLPEPSELRSNLGIQAHAAPAYASNPRNASVSILIADDHAVVRAGLRTILELHDGWRVVDEACDGKEAIAKAVAIKPHIAIIDQSLPVMNGVEVTRQIRSRSPGTEVLAFTTDDSDMLVGDLLQAGARACILKSDDGKQLVHAVEALALHQPFFTGSLSQTMLDAFLTGQSTRCESPLTPRERSVVQLIAEGHTNKEMSRILCLSIKTIETHRASAMRRLNLTSVAGLVRYAIRNKLVEP